MHTIKKIVDWKSSKTNVSGKVELTLTLSGEWMGATAEPMQFETVKEAVDFIKPKIGKEIPLDAFIKGPRRGIYSIHGKRIS